MRVGTSNATFGGNPMVGFYVLQGVEEINRCSGLGGIRRCRRIRTWSRRAGDRRGMEFDPLHRVLEARRVSVRYEFHPLPTAGCERRTRRREQSAPHVPFASTNNLRPGRVRAWFLFTWPTRVR